MQKTLILLSTYNGERYLEEQLVSIFIQRGVEAKLLVRDDGSTDQTVAILEKNKKEKPETFEDIIIGENIGSTASFKELMRIAFERYGDAYAYYAFADQDDYWLQDKLWRAVQKLEVLDNSTPNMYCSDKIIVDSELKEIRGIRPAKVDLTKGRALARNIATGCTMVFNRSALELFVTREMEFIKIHDHAIFLICSFLGTVIYDDSAYILYRQHGSNQIGGTDTIKSRYQDRLKKKGNLREHFSEKVAQSFLATYEDSLTKADIKLIGTMAHYRDSIGARFRLFFNREIAKERFEDNFFFKLKVLLGGV